MLDLIQAQEALKDASDQRLLQEMQQPTGVLPPYLVLGEMKRRQDLRQQAQTRQVQQQQGTVAQDLTQQTVAANAPMAPPAQMGAGMPPMMPPQAAGVRAPAMAAAQQQAMPPQTMVPPRGMARGGIVEVDQSERMRGAVSKLRETARNAPDMLRRGAYLDRVARDYGLDPQEFRAAVGAQPRDMRAGGPVMAQPQSDPEESMIAAMQALRAVAARSPGHMGNPGYIDDLAREHGVDPDDFRARTGLRYGAGGPVFANNGWPPPDGDGERVYEFSAPTTPGPYDAMSLAEMLRLRQTTRIPSYLEPAFTTRLRQLGQRTEEAVPADVDPQLPPLVEPVSGDPPAPVQENEPAGNQMLDNEGNPIVPPIPPPGRPAAAPGTARTALSPADQSRAAAAAAAAAALPNGQPGSPATEAGQRLDRYDQLLKAIARRQEGADERQAEARDMALLQMGLRMMGSPQPFSRALSEAGVPALASMQQARSEARRDQREAMRDELDVEKVRAEEAYRRGSNEMRGREIESRERISEADRRSADQRNAATIAAAREGRVTPQMYMNATLEERAIFDRFIPRQTDPFTQELRAQQLELARQQAAARVETEIQRRQLEFAQNNGFTPNLSPEQLARMSQQGQQRYMALRQQYDAIGTEARRALQSGTAATSGAGSPTLDYVPGRGAVPAGSR